MRLPLLLKLALMACLLAVVPLSVVGLVLVDVNRETVTRLNQSVQAAVLRDLSQFIEAMLLAAQDDLATVGRLFADGELTDDARLRVIRSEIEGSQAIDHVALYDAQGALVAVVEEEGVQGVTVPQSLPAELRAALDQDAEATGEVTSDESGVRLFVAVRIRVDGATTGYVGSAISLAAMQSRVGLLSEEHFPGHAGGMFVVDSDFRLLAHHQAARAMAREEVRDGILREVNWDVRGAGIVMAGAYVASDGTPMLGSTIGMRGRGHWALVAELPQAVAYASLNEMRRLILATVAGAILIALLLGLLLARSISRPLATLTSFADKLARRDFFERVTVRTRDELAVLGHALNRAAGDLQASEAQIRHEVAVRTDLGRYVPEQLVDRILRREADMKLGGERRIVTVLFADVVGFTALTDRLPPEATVAMLNELFTILTQIVFKHRGTVDKFIGDCVMAFWNAPGDQPDHVRLALETAEDMQSWLETGNERWKAKYGVTIELAIGVHTGEAVIGNIGSETRMEYTAIGNTVNLAARLEAVARPSQILVTDAVKLAAGEGFEMADAGEQTLAGWPRPIRLWELRS